MSGMSAAANTMLDEILAAVAKFPPKGEQLATLVIDPQWMGSKGVMIDGPQTREKLVEYFGPMRGADIWDAVCARPEFRIAVAGPAFENAIAKAEAPVREVSANFYAGIRVVTLRAPVAGKPETAQ